MNMWGKNKKEDNNIKNFTVGEDRHYDLYLAEFCLLYTSPSPRDMRRSRMPSSA